MLEARLEADEAYKRNADLEEEIQRLNVWDIHAVLVGFETPVVGRIF